MSTTQNIEHLFTKNGQNIKYELRSVTHVCIVLFEDVTAEVIARLVFACQICYSSLRLNMSLIDAFLILIQYSFMDIMIHH